MSDKKTNLTKNNMGSIRIISGLHKGRKLPVLNLEGLRPTTDRVKETLFNWLMFKIIDANVLDLFSGAGSLGFEALSRQAKKVTMIELSQLAYKNLVNNAQLLKVTNVSIHNVDACDFIKKTQDKYDIIFMDPPFRKSLVEKIFSILDESILNPGCQIYVEQEKESSFVPPAKFKQLKEKVSGQVKYSLYEFQTTD